MLSVHTADVEFLLCPSGIYPINIIVQTCTICMYVHCYYVHRSMLLFIADNDHCNIICIQYSFNATLHSRVVCMQGRIQKF